MRLKSIVAEFIYSNIRDIDVCCIRSNTNIDLNYFRNKFDVEKEDEITIYSMNINGLRTEG